MEDLREYIGNWAIESDGFLRRDLEVKEDNNENTCMSTPSRERESDHSRRNRKTRSRDHDSSNYIRRQDGLSPLRSPLNSECHSKLDSAERNRYSSRRPRHNTTDSRHRSDRAALSPEKKNRFHQNQSPTTPQTMIMLDKDSDEGTPVVTKLLCQESRASFSHSFRRRLNLPQDGSAEAVENATLTLDPKIQEDKITLARREKQIEYGKNTDSYRLYISTVPKNERGVDRIKHPRTPLKWRKCSRRTWDNQVKDWKRRIHQWAGDEHALKGNFSFGVVPKEDWDIPGVSQSTRPQSSATVQPQNGSCLDHCLRGFQSFPALPSAGASATEQKADKPVANVEKVGEEEDDSFLEGFDFEFDPETLNV